MAVRGLGFLRLPAALGVSLFWPGAGSSQAAGVPDPTYGQDYKLIQGGRTFNCGADGGDCSAEDAALNRLLASHPEKRAAYDACCGRLMPTSEKIHAIFADCIQNAGFPNPDDAANQKEKFGLGDLTGAQACAAAQRFLGTHPDDQAAFGTKMMYCDKDPLPKADLAKPQPLPNPPPKDETPAGRDILRSPIPLIGMNASGAHFGDNARKTGPSGVDEKLARLAALRADGNYPGVLAAAEEVLAGDPRNAAALNAKALAQNRTKDYKGALETAAKAIRDDPKNAGAHANKAYALGALGDRKGMIEELRAAAGLDSQFEAALQKALNADSADLFDMPGEVQESKLQGTRARESSGLTPEMLKGIIIGAVVVPLLGLIIFFVLRNTVFKTPPPKPATPWAQAAKSEHLQGKYQLGRQIGAGGMGIVYEGKDLSLHRRVAIKKMLPQLAAQPKLRERFVAEARTVAGLHHSRIVDIHAIVEEEQELYLVFEFVDGRTLAELIAERGRLAYADSVAIVRGIAEALDFAHGRGIIHRDLKPSNIMVGDSRGVVVMDFGLARAVQELMTQAAFTNTVVGTPAYMAPEQEKGAVCKQSDVYSLAICFYEMLSGRRPFDGGPGSMTAAKLGMAYQPVTNLAASLPGRLDSFFSRALAADPSARFPSPKELAAALDAITPVPAVR